jgi:hypothetical protein
VCVCECAFGWLVGVLIVVGCVGCSCHCANFPCGRFKRSLVALSNHLFVIVSYYLASAPQLVLQPGVIWCVFTMAARSEARYVRALAFELGGEIAEVEAQMASVVAAHRDTLDAALAPLRERLTALQAEKDMMFPPHPAWQPPVSLATTAVYLRQHNAQLLVVRDIASQTSAAIEDDRAGDECEDVQM